MSQDDYIRNGKLSELCLLMTTCRDGNPGAVERKYPDVFPVYSSGFCIRIFQLCEGCQRLLIVDIKPLSAVSFVVHTEDWSPDMLYVATTDFTEYLKTSFRVMDFNFTATCTCKQSWTFRVWPDRQRRMQRSQQRHDLNSITPIPSSQVWHFPHQVQWAMWIARASGFRFALDELGSKEASTMLPSHGGGTWRMQCDTWADCRPDLLDLPDDQRLEWTLAIAEGRRRCLWSQGRHLRSPTFAVM
jgi:hypothetical protein